MNRFVACLLVLLAASKAGLSQPAPALLPHQLRADLEQMRLILEAWHPGYANYQSRDSLRQQFGRISRQMDRPMTDRQFLRLARVASTQIQCLHTTVSLPAINRSPRNQSKKYFPFPLALTPANKLINQATGDTIYQLNKRSAQVITDSLLMLFTSDGPNTSLKRWAVNRQFGSLYVARFGMTDTVQLTVASPKGLLNEQQAVANVHPDSVSAYLADQPHRIVQSSRDMTLYKLTGQPDVAVLQLRSVGGILNQFRLRRMCRWLRKQPVRQLVLDLRNNTGGRIWTAATLLKQLLPQPATVTFERYRKPKDRNSFGIGNRLFRPFYNARLAIRTSVSRTDERVRYTYTIRPAPDLFDGALTVLTNGGTASAASLIAAYLREQNRAVFIGEETGGSRFVSAGMLVPTLRLRYSHVRVRVPLFQVIHNSATANDGHGIQPDVPVYEWTSTKDLVMQKALEQSSQSSQPGNEQPGH